MEEKCEENRRKSSLFSKLEFVLFSSFYLSEPNNGEEILFYFHFFSSKQSIKLGSSRLSHNLASGLSGKLSNELFLRE